MSAFANHVKTVLLLGALMGLFLLVGAQWGTQGMVMALVLGGAMNVGAWFFSDRLAIAAMQGREITPQGGPEVGAAVSSRELYAMVDELRQRAGLPMPRVYLCPHDAPNAFATGRSPSKGAVAVTQGLLRMMSREELRGVIAHELAHIKNRDTLISCIAATVAGVLAFLAQWGMFLGGGRGGREGGNPLAAILVVVIAALGAALIRAAISRSREFIADADGARIAGSPEGLASALGKLEALSRRIPLVQPNPAQNNLFIVEPFCGRTLTNLFATHPPTERRIAALRALRGG
ncbi:MAG: zinc metalloprotease HtpX [Phycisphaerales bacterium]|nr:zinc metalloprotease HtpX [Phycisphaerales bacterium]